MQCKVLEIMGEWQEVPGQAEPTFVDKVVLQGQDGLHKITVVVMTPRDDDFEESMIPKHNELLEVAITRDPNPAREPVVQVAQPDDQNPVREPVAQELIAQPDDPMAKYDQYRFPHLQRNPEAMAA